MSWQYESVTHTSQLPDWISEESLANRWLVRAAGTHGDETEYIEHIRSRMALEYNPHGMLPLIVNRQAADSNKRCITRPELMARQGDFKGKDNEDRAAAGFTWLIDQLDPNRVVIDHHVNSSTNRYFQIGSRVTIAALTAGWRLGHTDVWLNSWSPFNNTHPSILSSEESVPSDADERQRYFEDMDNRFRDIAKRGHAGLEKLFHEQDVVNKLHYYEAVTEVLLADTADLTPNQSVIDILPEIESLKVDSAKKTTITLSTEAQEVLGLPPRPQYYAIAGGYHNRSEVLSNHTLGVPDDRLRRVGWGAILMDCPPPQLDKDNGLLVFGSV